MDYKHITIYNQQINEQNTQNKNELSEPLFYPLPDGRGSGKQEKGLKTSIFGSVSNALYSILAQPTDYARLLPYLLSALCHSSIQRMVYGPVLV